MTTIDHNSIEIESMNAQKFLEVLDDDRGTGHSFFDPFVKDGADPNDHLEDMIQIALETHGEERGDDGTPTGWALTSRKYLKKFLEDQEFRASATEAVRAQAFALVESANADAE